MQIATVNTSFEQLVLYHLQYFQSEETIFEYGYNYFVLDKYARHSSPYIIMLGLLNDRFTALCR